MLEKVIAAISNDPELLSYVNEVVNREDLRLIVQHTKGEELSPKAVIQMFKIMKALEEGKGNLAMAWIEKRGDKYRVKWNVGTPGDSHRRVASFDSWDEADKFRKKIDYESSIGIDIDPTKMTVAEYFDHWLKIHGPNLEPKTLASYKCEVKNHIAPSLGNIKLPKLSPIHLQNYYVDLLNDGKASIIRRRIERLEKQLSEKEVLKDKQALTRAKKRLAKMKAEENVAYQPHLSAINIESFTKH